MHIAKISGTSLHRVCKIFYSTLSGSCQKTATETSTEIIFYNIEKTLIYFFLDWYLVVTGSNRRTGLSTCEGKNKSHSSVCGSHAGLPFVNHYEYLLDIFDQSILLIAD